MNGIDANFLLTVQKFFVKPKNVILPVYGSIKVYELTTETGKYTFYFDYDRRGMYEDKTKMQLRYYNIPIIRLELNTRFHQNPDKKLISKNHIHIYDKKNIMQYAYELQSIFDEDIIKMNTADRFILFCNYAKINIKGINLQEVL